MASRIISPRNDSISDYYERQIQRCQKVVMDALTEVGWSFESQSGGIDVYSRPDPNSDYDCYRCTCDIEASSSVLLEVFSSFGHRRLWDDSFEEGRIVARHDPLTQIHYLSFKSPWPIQDRDFVIISRTVYMEDGSLLLISTSVEHNECPLNSNLTRCDLFFGAVRISSRDTLASQVTYLVACDSKFGAPTFLINQSNKNSAVKFLDSVRKYVSENSHLCVVTKPKPQVKEELDAHVDDDSAEARLNSLSSILSALDSEVTNTPMGRFVRFEASSAATISKLQFLYTDLTSRAYWDDAFDCGRLLGSGNKKSGDHNLILQTVNYPPEPSSMCLASKQITDAEGTVYILSASVLHDMVSFVPYNEVLRLKATSGGVDCCLFVTDEKYGVKLRKMVKYAASHMEPVLTIKAPVSNTTTMNEKVPPSDPSLVTPSAGTAEAPWYLTELAKIRATVTRELTDPSWKFHARMEDVDIYLKKIGTVNCSKGIGTIQASAETVMGVFADIDNRKSWDSMLEQGTTVKILDESRGIRIMRFSFNAPLFVSKRDLIVMSRTVREKNGEIWSVSCSVLHGPSLVDCPEVNGYVRAKLMFGGTIIKPITEESCEVTYILASDPSGSLPDWVVALASITQPLCLSKIRGFISSNPKLLPVMRSRVETLLVNSEKAAENEVFIDNTETNQADFKRFGVEMSSQATDWSLASNELGCYLPAVDFVSRSVFRHLNSLFRLGISATPIGYFCLDLIQVKSLKKHDSLKASVSLGNFSHMTDKHFPVETTDHFTYKFNDCLCIPVFSSFSRLRVQFLSDSNKSDRKSMDRLNESVSSLLLGQTFLSLGDIDEPNVSWLELIGGDESETLKPLVQVKCTFVFSELLDFASSVGSAFSNDESEDFKLNDQLPEYVPEKMVDNFYRVLKQMRPFTNAFSWLLFVVNWNVPSLTLSIVFLTILCAIYPYLFPCILVVCLIVFHLQNVSHSRFSKANVDSDIWARLETIQKEKLGKIIDALKGQSPGLNEETRGLLRKIQYESGTLAVALESTFGLESNSNKTQGKLLFGCICLVLACFVMSIYTLFAILVLIFFSWNSNLVTTFRKIIHESINFFIRRQERKKRKLN